MTNSAESVLDLYALAARLGVGIGEACDRAGISRSTPPRWKRGIEPRPQQIAVLRQAIIEVARGRGVIDAAGDAGAPIDRASCLAALAAARDTVSRLELALGITGTAA